MKTAKHRNLQRGNIHLHILPVAVWLAVVAVIIVLFSHRSQRFEVLGIAQSQSYQVAATCDGRLKSINIELYDKVTKQQRLVVIDTVLDNENLQSQLSVISAEIRRLQAELAPTKQQLLAEEADSKTNKITADRRFLVDIENTRLRTLELKTIIETDRIILEDLAIEVKIVQQLLKEDAVEPYQLQKQQAQYDALKKKIQENQLLLAQAKKDLNQAIQRREEFASRQDYHRSVDSALEIIRKAIEVQEKQTEAILARREPLILKSPIDGMVSQILRKPGETVLVGEAILIITTPQPQAIVAYADQRQADKIKEGMVVELITNSQPAQVAKSQVIKFGPAVELMPEQLWRNPAVPQWGRPIFIAVHPDMKVIPGQIVGIRGL